MVLQDEEALEATAAPEVGGQAGAVLSGQVTQMTKLTRQSLQDAKGSLTQSRAQGLWRKVSKVKEGKREVKE